MTELVGGYQRYSLTGLRTAMSSGAAEAAGTTGGGLPSFWLAAGLWTAAPERSGHDMALERAVDLDLTLPPPETAIRAADPAWPGHGDGVPAVDAKAQLEGVGGSIASAHRHPGVARPHPASRISHGVTVEALEAGANRWPRSARTPANVTGLLDRTRELFIDGYYPYANFADAAVRILQAVEAALRTRLSSSTHQDFAQLIDRGHADGLITDEARDTLHAGRRRRNSGVHATAVQVWTPAAG